MAAERIFHIARRANWEAAQESGEYRISSVGQSLAEVGFVHCSFEHQVSAVARKHYREIPDLVLLEIDPDLLAAEVKPEAPPDSSEKFPHIYGPINVDAVVAAGAFTVPD